MPRVNQSDLIMRLALEFDLPVSHAKKMVDFLVTQMSEELIKGNPVSLWRFGTFHRAAAFSKPTGNFGKGGIAHYKPRVRLVTSLKLRRRL